MDDGYFLLTEVANSTDRQHIEWQKAWGLGFIIECVKEHGDISHAIQSRQLNKAFQLMKKLHDAGSSKTPSQMVDIQYHLRDLHRAQLAWKEPYISHTATVFEQAVREAARMFSSSAKHQCLAKIMPIVQSFGAGKSRLIDHYGNSHLGVVYTLRVYDQSVYPPGDPDIMSLMLSSIAREDSTKDGLEHATAVGLIGSTISYGKFGYLFLAGDSIN